MEHSDAESHGSDTSILSSSRCSAPAQLVGEDDDCLIPSQSDICRIFHNGQETWSFFVDQAKSCPRGLWPTNLLDPYTAISDIPRLPTKLPRTGTLHGRPQWCLEGDGITESDDGNERTNRPCNDDRDGWDPELMYGRRITFQLHIEDPMLSELSEEAGSSYLDDSLRLADSIAILTLCWSYILSVRFLELQGRKVHYSKHRLCPSASPAKSSRATIFIHGASNALTRWLCADLSPRLGWSPEGKGLPPWTACLSPSVPCLIIDQDTKPATQRTLDEGYAPSSSEATELLIELCHLFGLGDRQTQGKDATPLAPYLMAFLAALLIPFYRTVNAHPVFPYPSLKRSRPASRQGTDQHIYQYVEDAPNFMTLSMQPGLLGSTL